MEKEKERKTGIDCLRIVAMIIVILIILLSEISNS